MKMIKMTQTRRDEGRKYGDFDKIAKTKTLHAGDVKPLKDDLAGGGFISKEMIGAIVFSKPNHARDARTAPTRLPLTYHSHKRTLTTRVNVLIS